MSWLPQVTSHQRLEVAKQSRLESENPQNFHMFFWNEIEKKCVGKIFIPTFLVKKIRKKNTKISESKVLDLPPPHTPGWLVTTRMTWNTAYAARISTNIIQMPTQASAHHLNAYANTSQDIVYLNWSFLLKNVAHLPLVTGWGVDPCTIQLNGFVGGSEILSSNEKINSWRAMDGQLFQDSLRKFFTAMLRVRSWENKRTTGSQPTEHRAHGAGLPLLDVHAVASSSWKGSTSLQHFEFRSSAVSHYPFKIKRFFQSQRAASSTCPIHIAKEQQLVKCI